MAAICESTWAFLVSNLRLYCLARKLWKKLWPTWKTLLQLRTVDFCIISANFLCLETRWRSKPFLFCILTLHLVIILLIFVLWWLPWVYFLKLFSSLYVPSINGWNERGFWGRHDDFRAFTLQFWMYFKNKAYG